MDLVVDRDRGVLAVVGNLDLRTVGPAREALRELLASYSGDVILDVSELELVDAAGLGVIVAAHRRAMTAGRRLILRGVSPGLSRLLTLTRLHRVLHVERPLPAS